MVTGPRAEERVLLSAEYDNLNTLMKEREKEIKEEEFSKSRSYIFGPTKWYYELLRFLAS